MTLAPTCCEEEKEKPCLVLPSAPSTALAGWLLEKEPKPRAVVRKPSGRQCPSIRRGTLEGLRLGSSNPGENCRVHNLMKEMDSARYIFIWADFAPRGYSHSLETFWL